VALHCLAGAKSYSDDFVFATEILVATVLGGFRSQEVAIPTRYTRESSPISVRRSLQHIQGSIEVCWRASGSGAVNASGSSRLPRTEVDRHRASSTRFTNEAASRRNLRSM
jgi:hypothetical protein